MPKKHPHRHANAPADHLLIYVNSHLFGQTASIYLGSRWQAVV